MLKTYRYILLFCILHLQSNAQSWSLAGPDDGNQPANMSYNTVDLISDNQGGLYFAGLEGGNTAGNASVRHFSNGVWSQVGLPRITGFSIDFLKIAAAANGTPYIVYKDRSFQGKAVVRTFNGTNWVQVGSPVSDGGAFLTDIVLDNNDMPIVAYQDSLLGRRVTVKRWNGTSWVVLGNSGFTPSSISYRGLRLKRSAAGIPHILVEYQNGTSILGNVYKFENNNWDSLGIFSNVNADIDKRNTDITFGQNDTVFIAYNNSIPSTTYNHRIKIKKLVGNSWVNVGADSTITTGNINSINIAYDNQKGLHFACLTNTIPGSTVYYGITRRFDGNYWVLVGQDTAVTKEYAQNMSFALDTAHKPNMLYYDGVHYGKFIMQHFNNTSWAISGTSSGLAEAPTWGNYSAAKSPDGSVAYVATSDFSGYDFSGSKVAAYTNGAWNIIADPSNVPWVGSVAKINVHPDGTPWVLIEDTASFPALYSFWKYNNGVWNSVAISTAFTSSEYGADFSFAPDGTIYFINCSYTYGTRVRKYTATTGWVLLGGNPTQSTSCYPYTKFAIDNFGIPHIMMTDHSSGTYIMNIYKYINNSWIKLFSSHIQNTGNVIYGSNPDFAFDSLNNIYLNYSNQYSVAVRKYDSNTQSFSNVGSGTALNVPGRQSKIEFSPDGTLYLYYSLFNTALGKYEIMVYKLEGNNWVNVGGSPYTKGIVWGPRLFFLNNEILSLHNDGAVYGYKYACAQNVTISQQPRDTTVCAGNAAGFTVNASGVLNYKWQYFDGTVWKVVIDGGIFSGANTATLTINSVGAQMNGYLYRCVLNNSCAVGMFTTVAKLSVDTYNMPAPSVIITSDLNEVCAGTPITITTISTNGGGNRIYEWRVNTNIVASGPDSFYTSSTLQSGDIVTCNLIRTSACDMTVQSALSNILNFQIGSTQQSVVTIQANPGSSINPGETISFTAIVEHPGLGQQYQWYVNNTAIVGETTPVFTTNTLANGDQVKVEVNRADTCNNISTVTSSPLNISVGTGIRNTETNFDLSVFPVPARDWLYLSSDASLPDGKYNLLIYSQDGIQQGKNTIVVKNGEKLSTRVKLPNSMSNGVFYIILKNEKVYLSSTFSIDR